MSCGKLSDREDRILRALARLSRGSTAAYWLAGARRRERRLRTAERETTELLVKAEMLETLVASKTASEKDQERIRFSGGLRDGH